MGIVKLYFVEEESLHTCSYLVPSSYACMHQVVHANMPKLLYSYTIASVFDIIILLLILIVNRLCMITVMILYLNHVRVTKIAVNIQYRGVDR